MPHRGRGPLPWLAIALVANVSAIGGAAIYLNSRVVGHEDLTALALVSVAGAVLMFALAWKIVDFQVFRLIRRMAADVRAIAHGSTRQGVDLDRYALMLPLPEAINQMAIKLVQTRQELETGLGVATAKAEENSARLAAILNDLHEGVLVCNQRHQVVLYNSVAMEMLSQAGQLGLGRSLFEAIAREPVVHMHEVLLHRPELGGKGTPFLAGSVDGHMLLQARMTLIRSADGDPGGYVVTLVDAGPQVAALASRDVLLREITEGLESPLIRLRVAASNPTIVEREAANIERAIKKVTDGYQRALSGWWPMTDVHSADFFAFVAKGVESEGLKVTVTGLPVWLHADSHSLALAVDSLIRQMAERLGLAEIDLAAGADDDSAWIEIGWPGATAAKPALDGWLAKGLTQLAGMTVKDVLAHHAGDSIGQEHRQGRSWLRLPMRKGVEVHFQPKAQLPTRPEFYDLSLLDGVRDIGEMGRLPLKTLTFIVFDTETTGLQPSQGDQIVQIGAVRVVNGRILSGESFNRIVNPGRPIPPESIKFHGITDDMVIDKPPLSVVLPQFKAFAADSVLVAHNAAFDLKFLRMNERQFGVRFDNPVLDTMMLSNYLDGPENGHSLDAICDRFGIEITDRHTALGDAIVTAAVLLKQIDMLEMRGITTLDQVVRELDLKMVLHQRQQAL
ncbi:putative DNA polymerase III subunit epsilon-like protein [Magnetospirillum sp. LM-5]|nr:putative DNA polymerase III subunit epsilon-like protein [Magnetospirillum sp. LM-5]